MKISFTRKEEIGLIILSVYVALVTYYGWQLFWFLTDDAYIAFRYISNSNLGFGYVWNPPPFRPVEGYTSFLWVVLLDMIWRITGVEPPDSANYLSLFFSYLTLFVGSAMVLNIQWNGWLRKYRVIFLSLVLTGIITNRTFLAWTSSGLETAMFNFFFIIWVYYCIFLPTDSKKWVFGVSLATAFIYLTRPDGILIALSSVLIMGVVFFKKYRQRELKLIDFALFLPLAVIPLHIIWRKLFYGEWLPNTYYAKTIPGRIWYQSGVRYFLSFVIEYALWVLLILLFFIIIKELRAIKECGRKYFAMDTNRKAKYVVILTLVAHFLYYTIIIGGDHFEFRVYSHLIILLFISILWMLNKIKLGALSSGLIIILFIILSWIIPWTHWSITHTLKSEEIASTRISVAAAIQKKLPATPQYIVWYLNVYDRLQAWLISQGVCVRHQEHKLFHLFKVSTLPSRKTGMTLPSDNFPVLPYRTVGVIAWVLPKVNIIDMLGLNDNVIAHNPNIGGRMMAHERRPPPGYVECFSPNVTIVGKEVIINKREEPLTADKIIECAEHYESSEHIE
jgi:arabinofuranosyltransferase